MMRFHQSGYLDDALETNSPRAPCLKTATSYNSYAGRLDSPARVLLGCSQMTVGLELSEGTTGLDVHSGFLTLVLGTWAGTAGAAWGRLVSLSLHAASSWVWTSHTMAVPRASVPKGKKQKPLVS